MGILVFVLQRLLTLFWVLIGASILIFLILRFLPGDPVMAMIGADAPMEQIEQMRRDLGLDRGVAIQYLDWIWGVAQGDLGTSLVIRRPVFDLILARFPVTLHIAASSLVVALLIALPAGVFAAVHKGRFIDHFCRVIALIGVSMPNFWLGLLFIAFFAVALGILPPGGYVSPRQDLGLSLLHIIGPALALGAYYAATITRMLRASMLDVLGRDYVLVARSLGIPERTVLWRDSLTNAFIPTLTVTGFAFGYMLAGVILVEVIFNIPGTGRLLYESILNRDYPMVQGIVLFNVALFVLINFFIDMLYVYFDPRLRSAS